MNNITRAFIILAACACLLGQARAAKLNLPGWLNEAVARKAGYERGLGSAVLHNECVSTVATNGKTTSVIMKAVLIRSDDASSSAAVTIHYNSSSEKITKFRAWLIKPDGDGKDYRIKDAMDTSLSRAIYTEHRHIVLSVAAEAYKGCIFAYEYTKEDRGIFGQDTWFFHGWTQVALSRLIYKLPKGWSIRGVMYNSEQVEPSVNGDTHTWEMRDLRGVRNEPMGPAPGRVVPRLNIDLFPPEGMVNPPIVSFPTWTEVSKYLSGLQLAPGTPDAAVEAKTRELLTGAGDDLWNRINALARHAQSINYIMITMNLGRGGGYTPRAAPEVLKTGYGDCKDKTALLRAMLTVAGIESYPAAVYSGDRYRVTEDWPSPRLFNHMIIAIRINDPSVESPAIVEHPELGRMLVFDPTDQFTPLGDLPYRNQGALALVLAGEKGGLLRLPFTPPSANHTERTIEAVIDERGSIGARITERLTGQTAARTRARYRTSRIKYPEVISRWIGETVSRAKVGNTEGIDNQEEGTFEMKTAFAAPGYANMMRDKLLVFKPMIVSRRGIVPLTQSRRTQPVFIEPVSYGETTIIHIPDGYAVDEMPRAVELETAFGRYEVACAYAATTHTIRTTRALTMKAAEIPAKDYASVRDFFETINKAEQAPVVLSRTR